MPTLDYVSIVRSVYQDRRALLFGALASSLTAGTSAWRTHSWPLLAITLLFMAVGTFRYFNMRAFWQADIASDDAERAEYWEARATIGGCLVASVYGIWCFCSLVLVDDAFAQLASVSISIAAMFRPNGTTASARNTGPTKTSGARKWTTWSAERGTRSSLMMALIPSAAGCRKPNGPTRFGP